MGIVEIHTWNSTADDIERPNRIMWDLDPGPEVSWPQVVKAAELSGAGNVLFRRNSVTGAIEAVPWQAQGIALNADLHAN